MNETNSDDFVVVANRLPVDLETPTDGGPPVWRRSPGGLVTAMETVLRSSGGAWVGWPGTPDVTVEPFEEDGLSLYPVELSAQEVEEYYEGFSNDTLWPLYHDALIPPTFDRRWWRTYRAVNKRFAEAAARAAAPGATVWVHDYQLQLVPRMLRELRPDVTIGFFLHIPFPPTELFLQLPWRKAIVDGLLGADLVGFHLPGGAQNFVYLANRLFGLPAPRGTSSGGTIDLGDRQVRVDATRSPSTPRSSGNVPETRTFESALPRSAGIWAIRRSCCSASTVSTTPRESTYASRLCTSCSPKAPSIPRRS